MDVGSSAFTPARETRAREVGPSANHVDFGATVEGAEPEVQVRVRRLKGAEKLRHASVKGLTKGGGDDG